MSTKVKVNVQGYYSGKTGYVLAKVVSKGNRTMLFISRRQLREAKNRLCYAWIDGIEIEEVDGYLDWSKDYDGNYYCHSILSDE